MRATRYYELIENVPVEIVDPKPGQIGQALQRNRTIELTQIGPCEVSTVFLVIDHCTGFEPNPSYAPLVFETMVFAGAFEAHYCCRYRSYQCAVDGHTAVVDRLQTLHRQQGGLARLLDQGHLDDALADCQHLAHDPLENAQ